ncbi:MAG: TIGR01244 family phosphatase [Rhodobacteraceae bacterium]|nr:TIGR01244 family phosphatase [Paracoccaceae bacterium]
MDIKQIDHDYSVSGQLTEADLVAVKAAGFATVICNRPDDEIEPDLHAQFMAAEAARLGLGFVYNPVSGRGMTMTNLQAQEEAIAASGGPVLAYCRSGMRSTVVWSLVNAKTLPADEIIATAAGAGYSLDNLRPQIEAFARS